MIVDPLASPELLIYNFSNGGYYLPTIKSQKIVREELKYLGFNSKLISNLKDLENLKDTKVIIEFKLDVKDAIRVREIAMKNDLVIFLVVLKNFYDERTLDQLKFVCNGIILIEAEKVGEKFIYSFAVPKMIGGISMASYIRYKTEKSVLEIDTSRDIA